MSDNNEKRDIPWGAVVLLAIGAICITLGLRQYVVHGVSWTDLLYCALNLLSAGVFLLVTSYVVQHARLAAIMPAALGTMFAVVHPSFAVALGLTIFGSIGFPLVGGWVERRRSELSP